VANALDEIKRGAVRIFVKRGNIAVVGGLLLLLQNVR
jgi:hypothetical protein